MRGVREAGVGYRISHDFRDGGEPVGSEGCPVGYKLTEVGVIPEDWGVNTFDQICKVNQGLQIAIERRKKHPSSKSKVYITVQYVNSDDEPEYIDDYSSSVCCEPEDVLMTRTGNTGIVVTGETGVFHNNFFKINFNREKINSGFFIYYLRSHDCQKTILEKAGISTIPDLNHGDFYSIQVALPSFGEQTAIANALSDVDALITSLEKLITKKRAIKTAAMQQLLTGKKRLPPFGQVHTGYKQTELGEIPEDWEVISIDQAITRKIIFDQMDGNHGELYPKSHEFSDSGIPYIGATDFDNGIVNFKRCKYLPEKRANLFKKGIAKKGDVLFAHNATVGPVALIDTDIEFVILSTTATYYRCNDKYLYNTFLKAYFESAYFVKQYTSVMSQSTRNQVPILAQRKFLLLVPSIEEQAAIANVISDMDMELAVLQQRLYKTRQLKQAMMQELLTGRTRLV